MQEQQALYDRLDKLISLLSKPKVADNKTLWDSQECADYLKLTKQKFMGDVAGRKTFPRPKNVGGSENRTNWRWVAGDVIAWALAQGTTTKH